MTGPESRCGTAVVPEGAEFVGVQLAVGTTLRFVAAPALVDSGLLLPDVTARSFALAGSRWETPAADDIEALVSRLARAGVLARDPSIARTAALLLAAGVPSAHVVHELAYYDEPHLARALRRYVGRTARQLREGAVGVLALDLTQRTSS